MKWIQEKKTKWCLLFDCSLFQGSILLKLSLPQFFYFTGELSQRAISSMSVHLKNLTTTSRNSMSKCIFRPVSNYFHSTLDRSDNWFISNRIEIRSTIFFFKFNGNIAKPIGLRHWHLRPLLRSSKTFKQNNNKETVLRKYWSKSKFSKKN